MNERDLARAASLLGLADMGEMLGLVVAVLHLKGVPYNDVVKFSHNIMLYHRYYKLPTEVNKEEITP